MATDLDPPAHAITVRPPLVVVGMHRSGTSFVSSLLHAAGVDMGSRLMPPARGNERGHYENLDFVEFHMRELRLTGHDDAGWAAVKSLVLSDDAAADAHHLIKTNGRDVAWGWKDPRTTLFLDFWSGIVPAAHFLYVYREPSEVIESLYRRGDEAIRLSPELAARAYLAHNEMMFEHARRHRDRGIVANISAIARDPEHFLLHLTRKFDLDVNANVPSTFEGELMQTIAYDASRATLLRHHLPEIDRLYEDLEREADLPSNASKGEPSSRRSIRDAFFDDWHVEKTWEHELSEKTKELESFRLATAVRDAELQATLAQTEARLIAAEARITESERRLAQTSRAFYTQTEALIASTRAEISRVEQLISTVQSSSFWSVKRGINSALRFLHLARR